MASNSMRIGISIDDIGAFLWHRTGIKERLELCAAAELPDAVAVATFDWFEIATESRDKVAGQMAMRIAFQASLQRRTAPSTDATGTTAQEAAPNTPSTTQLAIALGKLWNNRAADRDESWCDLDYQAVEYALGHPVDKHAQRT